MAGEIPATAMVDAVPDATDEVTGPLALTDAAVSCEGGEDITLLPSVGSATPVQGLHPSAADHMADSEPVEAVAAAVASGEQAARHEAVTLDDMQVDVEPATPGRETEPEQPVPVTGALVEGDVVLPAAVETNEEEQVADAAALSRVEQLEEHDNDEGGAANAGEQIPACFCCRDISAEAAAVEAAIEASVTGLWREEASGFLALYDTPGWDVKVLTDGELAEKIFKAENIYSRRHTSEDEVFTRELFFGLIVMEDSVSRSTHRTTRSFYGPRNRFRRERRLAFEEGVARARDKHRTVEQLRDVIQRLRSDVDRRLVNLHPTLEVFQGVTFKWSTAAVLAHLSEFVYAIKNETSMTELEQAMVEKAMAEKCKKWIADEDLVVKFIHSDEDNKKADNAALVVESCASVYLIFRGTVSTTNWLQNLKMLRKDFPINGVRVGRVLGGFLDAQDSLWVKLIEHLELKCGLLDPVGSQNHSRERQPRHVYIAGHSLGGAMAMITAARLVRDRNVKRIDGVYTFGSPGLFDHVAAAQYREHPVLKGRTFRVKYEGDVIIKSLSRLQYLNPGISIRLTERDGMSVLARRRHDATRFASNNGAIFVPQAMGVPPDVERFILTGGEVHGMTESYLATVDCMADQAKPGIRPTEVLT